MIASIFSIVGFFVVLCVLAAPFAFIIEKWSSYTHKVKMERHRQRAKEWKAQNATN